MLPCSEFRSSAVALIRVADEEGRHIRRGSARASNTLHRLDSAAGRLPFGGGHVRRVVGGAYAKSPHRAPVTVGERGLPESKTGFEARSYPSSMIVACQGSRPRAIACEAP